MDGDSVVKGGSVMEAGEGRYEKAGGADGLNAFATGLKTVDGLCHPSGEGLSRDNGDEHGDDG